MITSGIGSLRKTNKVTRLCLLPFSLAFLLEKAVWTQAGRGKAQWRIGDEDPKMPQKKSALLTFSQTQSFQTCRGINFCPDIDWSCLCIPRKLMQWVNSVKALRSNNGTNHSDALMIYWTFPLVQGIVLNDLHTFTHWICLRAPRRWRHLFPANRKGSGFCLEAL